MNSTQEPAHWTVARLTELKADQLHQLSQQAVSHLTRCRVLIGRCLLVMHRTDAVSQFGCSGAIQYAGMLGLSARLAGECIRVATALEELPTLRAAAERGTIGWCSLREVTHKATPATDARWLELAQQYTYGIIEDLVSLTEPGAEPADPT